MALPRNIRPEYSTTIPSTGQKIKYNPFSVKEEKILILAAESSDSDEVTNAISNVLKNCVTSPASFNVEELSLFDIEYLFLKTRAKSAGEKIKVEITDPDDDTFSTEHEINIDKIGIKRTEGHSNLVELNENTLVKMRYPDLSFFQDGIDINDMESITETIGRCIVQIVVDEEVFNSTDMSPPEVVEWLDGLTTEQFKKLSSFFETMPRLRHEITCHNPNTGMDFTITLEGLADFF